MKKTDLIFDLMQVALRIRDCNYGEAQNLLGLIVMKLESGVLEDDTFKCDKCQKRFSGKEKNYECWYPDCESIDVYVCNGCKQE